MVAKYLAIAPTIITVTAIIISITMTIAAAGRSGWRGGRRVGSVLLRISSLLIENRPLLINVRMVWYWGIKL